MLGFIFARALSNSQFGGEKKKLNNVFLLYSAFICKSKSTFLRSLSLSQFSEKKIKTQGCAGTCPRSDCTPVATVTEAHPVSYFPSTLLFCRASQYNDTDEIVEGTRIKVNLYQKCENILELNSINHYGKSVKSLNII